MRVTIAFLFLLFTATAAVAEQSRSDLQTALAQQVMHCWLPPIHKGAPKPAVVTLRMRLNRDGSIAEPPQLSASPEQSASDPFLLEAAEAGRHAIVACAPYKLPEDRYEQWRDIVIRFDPRIIAGTQ